MTRFFREVEKGYSKALGIKIVFSIDISIYHL